MIRDNELLGQAVRMVEAAVPTPTPTPTVTVTTNERTCRYCDKSAPAPYESRHCGRGKENRESSCMMVTSQIQPDNRTFRSSQSGRLAQHEYPLYYVSDFLTGKPNPTTSRDSNDNQPSARNQRLFSRFFGGALNGASMSISNRASSGWFGSFIFCKYFLRAARPAMT